MTQPRGLHNNGNTCYFNAVIQVLFRTTLFVKYVMNVFPSTSEDLLQSIPSNENVKNAFSSTSEDSLLTSPRRNGCMARLKSCVLWPVACVAAGLCWIIIVFQSLTSRIPKRCTSASRIAAYCCCTVFLICLFVWLIYLLHSNSMDSLKLTIWILCLVACVAAFACSICMFENSLLSNSLVLLRWLLPIWRPKLPWTLLVMTHKVVIVVGVALKKLFDELGFTVDKRSVNPAPVLDAVSSRASRFAGHNQQDSHELLRHLLDGLRADERQLNQLKQNMARLTLVDRIFGGHFITMYTCLYCGEVYSLCEPFLDISLPLVIHKETLKEVFGGVSFPSINNVDTPGYVPNPIEKEEMYLMEHHIETLLKVYTRKENLGKEYLCNACNKDRTDGGYDLTEGTKEALICDPPAVLCLHMKRFKEVPGAGHFEKINAHIAFSEHLDIKPYLSKDCKRVKSEQTSVLYSLYGVVVHSGSLRGGHYVAYVKSPQQQTETNDMNDFLQDDFTDSGNLGIDRDTCIVNLMPTVIHGGSQQGLTPTSDWYYCSDSIVYKVDASEVFRQQAFLLFYERIC